MKRLLLATALAGFLFAQPQPSHALIVACANCSTNVQQLLDYARQAEQLQAEVNSLRVQGAQYANALTNTISLPQSYWSNVVGTVGQVRGLANQASLLTGNSGGIMNRLNSAQGLAYSALATPQNAYNQYTMQRQTVGNAVQSLGSVLGVQQAQEKTYATLQQQIETQSQSAEGTKQAIQAGNEMTALANTQLNQIQTTLVAQAQMMATQAETEADRRALNDFALNQFASFTPVNLHGGVSYP